MIDDTPFLDLRVTNAGERREIMEAVEKVLDHGRIVLGPGVMELEERIAAACSRRFSVGVNSGTDALYLALRTLGFSQADEFITTAFSWIVTANDIRLTGGMPVFADIREDLNLDPASVESLITPNTQGTYIPPHRHGDRSESLHIIEGRIRAIFFDDNGNLVETLDLGDKGEPLMYRLAWDRWHTVIALSTQAVFHETVCGPFEAERVLLAPWAPRQDSVEQGQRFVTWLEGQTK